MGKLHQLLAVEADLKEASRVVLEETSNVFTKKGNLFMGSNRKYTPFDDNDNTVYPEEDQELTTTVAERLDYTSEFVSKYLDALLQKESTNQEAKAAIEIDGKAVTGELPATFLLGLETRLKELRAVYKSVPTLAQGVKWNEAPSIGKNVYVMAHPEQKFKTAKTFRHQVLVEATQFHPAQVEKWEEVENVGMYEKNIWSGMVTSARKAELLKRVDDLIVAVKQARQRANNIDVKKIKVANIIFEYINK